MEECRGPLKPWQESGTTFVGGTAYFMGLSSLGSSSAARSRTIESQLWRNIEDLYKPTAEIQHHPCGGGGQSTVMGVISLRSSLQLQIGNQDAKTLVFSLMICLILKFFLSHAQRKQLVLWISQLYAQNQAECTWYFLASIWFSSFHVGKKRGVSLKHTQTHTQHNLLQVYVPWT